MAHQANVGISSTDHTATPRPNFIHDQDRIPLFGGSDALPLEDRPNTDFDHTQVFEETQAKAHPVEVKQDEPTTPKAGVTPLLSESPASFFIKFLEPKEEANTNTDDTAHRAVANPPAGQCEEDSVTEPIQGNDPNMSDIFDSAVEDSEEELQTDPNREVPVLPEPPEDVAKTNDKPRDLKRNLTDN